MVVSGVCKGKAPCGGRHMRSSQAWGSMPLTTVPSPEVQHAHREVVLGGADEHSAVTSKAGGEGRGNATQTKHQTRKRGVLHPFTVGHQHRPAPMVAVAALSNLSVGSLTYRTCCRGCACWHRTATGWVWLSGCWEQVTPLTTQHPPLPQSMEAGLLLWRSQWVTSRRPLSR